MGKRPFSDEKGAAQYCHTTVRHIERVRSERRLAYIKVGTKVRFVAADLTPLLNSGRMEALR